MEKIDILIWVMGSGFAGTWAMMFYVAKTISQRMDRLDQRMDRLDQRMDRFEEKLTDIDRRLCRLEGAFASKDFCVLKDNRTREKAE